MFEPENIHRPHSHAPSGHSMANKVNMGEGSSHSAFVRESFTPSIATKMEPSCSVQCKVCGDVIRSRGDSLKTPACVSCCNFFKRSAVADSTAPKYACRANRNCLVTKRTRNRCQYCRLQKCFVAGMKRELQGVGAHERGSIHEAVDGCKQPTSKSPSGWMPPSLLQLQMHPQRTLPTMAVFQPVPYQFVYTGVPPQFVSVPMGISPRLGVYPVVTAPLGTPVSLATATPLTANTHLAQMAPLGSTVPSTTVEKESDCSHAVLSRSYTPCSQNDSGVDSHKDDDSVFSSNASSIFSDKSMPFYSPPSPPLSSSARTPLPELVSQTTSITECPSPLSQPPGEEVSPVEQTQEESEECLAHKGQSLLSGPDVPIPDVDLDELCKSHRDVHTLPQEKPSSSSQIGMQELIKNAKVSFGLFIKWIKGIPLFCAIPTKERVACVKACYIEQLMLTIMYRSLILRSEGMVMSSGKEFKPGEVNNALISYGIGRIIGELMGAFKSLDLDYKEFICLRLLFLFNPDSPEVESPVKEHIGRIQNVVLVTLEDYCTDQHPTTPLRYSKLLLSMASMRSISKEMTQESEVQTALATANFDSSQLFKFLDF